MANDVVNVEVVPPSATCVPEDPPSTVKVTVPVGATLLVSVFTNVAVNMSLVFSAGAVLLAVREIDVAADCGGEEGGAPEPPDPQLISPPNPANKNTVTTSLMGRRRRFGISHAIRTPENAIPETRIHPSLRAAEGGPVTMDALVVPIVSEVDPLPLNGF